MMQLLKNIFLYIVFTAVSLLCVAQEYTLKHFGHEEGLNLSSFLTVKESKNGYIWFGTGGAGLIRYDGKSFQPIRKQSGRNNRHVNDIYFSDNKVFFTTKFQGVFLYNKQLIQQLDFIKSLGKNEAVIQQQGRLIVLQDGVLKIYEDGSLINRKPTYPYDSHTYCYGYFSFLNNTLLFTSKGNYVIEDHKIKNLNEWLHTNKNLTKNIVGALKTGDSLVFIDKYLEQQVTVLMDGTRPKFFINQELNNNLLDAGEQVIQWDTKDGKTIFLTNKGGVIEKDNLSNSYKIIASSSKYNIHRPTDILMDRNGDIWITTAVQGIFRLSKEPFTRLDASPILRKSVVTFVAKIKKGKKIISTGQNGTYIGNMESKEGYENFPDLSVTSLTYYGEIPVISTNKGVYKVVENKLVLFEPLADLKGEFVTLVSNDFDFFWYGVAKKGLYRRDIKSGNEVYYSSAPGYFYNVISRKDSADLFFGTNNGLYKYNRKREKLTKVSSVVQGVDLGAYVGNSTQDVYGNLWFSFDNGLMGITPKGKHIAITAKRFLPSLLIYTLEADNRGNLYVGSNIGITVIQLKKNGNPISGRTYDKNNGFYGFETNMRASYKNKDGTILVGTIKGLFKIKPSYLMETHTPNPPLIYSVKNRNLEEPISSDGTIVLHSAENNLLIKFKSVNIKNSFALYSYRLKGKDKKWSDWSSKQQVIYNNLNPGDYVFEVKTSLDREKISRKSSISIKIKIPFYKNKWFIISIIGFLIVFYVFIVDRSKSYNRKNIIISRDVQAQKKSRKGMLLFGLIVNTLVHLFSPRMNIVGIENHDLSTIIVGVVILSIYLIITFVPSAKKKPRFYLRLNFIILLGYNLLYVYLTNIHPVFLVFSIILCFYSIQVFKQLKSIILLGLSLLAFSILIIFTLNETYFNQYLFVAAIAVTMFMMILNMYIRNNSLEQLIFTSGVVNNGNALVVAFNLKGKVTYVSENIELLLGIEEGLKGKPISYLNKFSPPSDQVKRDNFKTKNLAETFKEGEIFVTPLRTAQDKVVYYQWSCKEFSEEVRVVLGQDVTEKIHLENYYELIVKNAEDLIFEADTEGRFIFVNEKCVKILGESDRELINTSLLDKVDSSFKPIVASFFKEVQEVQEEAGYLEFPIHTTSLGKKWLGLKLTAMNRPGKEEEVIGFLGLARDVTEALQYNAIIEEQNKNITDSINYARRIQFNMLPRSEDFEKEFEDHFLVYRPKDIVAGDFYWLNKVNNKTILILSDCTGHGVPGAFMTLLGINILNQIILEGEVAAPGEILNQLDAKLTAVLPRDGQNKVRDGMEMIVCVFEDKKDSLQYATAGSRFIISDEEKRDLEIIKGQSKHIGDEKPTLDFKYITETRPLKQKQTIYLFTDGYPDQFGGDKDKKLTFKKFTALLEAIAPQDLTEQNRMLREHLTEWIGKGKQTDDITVIGVRGNRL